MATKHRSSPDLRIPESCRACLHFMHVKDEAGLCVAHGKVVHKSDFRCSTHFKPSTEKVPSATA